MIDGERCWPLLNGCLIAAFGSQDFQRGQSQSAQFGLHASLSVSKEQREWMDVDARQL